MPAQAARFVTPRDGDIGLTTVTNSAGMAASVLPNGLLFALEHRHEDGRIMLNQVLGSPVGGGIHRIYLRFGGAKPSVVEALGPNANAEFGASTDRFVWKGEAAGIGYRVSLWPAPESDAWFWHIEIINNNRDPIDCDAILVQDLGLAERGFLMNNEAYASQYIDHHIASDAALGPVIMSRQNLAQRGRYPWVMQGCLDGAAGFATDAMQLFGPRYRSAATTCPAFGTDLPSERLQHEVACACIRSRPLRIEPAASAQITFFGIYVSDHRAASGDADLALIEDARRAFAGFAPGNIPLRALPRSLTQDAAPLATHPMSEDELSKRYPTRLHEERADGRLLSFFVSDGAHNRHIVLAAKEAIVARRHGAILRSGQAMLPDESTLCATCWMHGVFAAQLTIGNTSLHKLFSVSRDPYNITRGSGLRMLVDTGGGWRLLAVPSIFEIGLSDCRWIYCLEDRTIAIEVAASGDDPAMQWRVVVDGSPCRFLIFGHLVIGEREFDQSGAIAIEQTSKRFTFRPDPAWLWGKRYPEAAYHLVTSTPREIEAIGGDELLYTTGSGRTGAYAVLRTRPVNEIQFAVTGSLTSAADGERLASKYERGVENDAMLAPAARFWRHVTRGLRLDRERADAGSFDTIFPWLAHNAMIHLTVPHGLEQYTGAAWGTRDVCQGPLEFFLALEHDRPVKEMLRKIFAQQYENRGDWPQWFMLEPYSNIQDAHAHGDVIIWPLKALCDYIEATNDLAFLEEPAPWRDEKTFAPTARTDRLDVHAARLIEAACAMFIPGTHLLRYGEGDWNDSLQPADPRMRDWMVSSWTVALFYQQLTRYAEVLRRAGRAADAKVCAELATRIRTDVNRYLIRDGTLAGYAIFDESGGEHELLLHPNDTRTGLKYSLLPMKRSIIGGLFTPVQTSHHRQIIQKHLLFPDGVRLMDRPVAYHGGLEEIFRRAESSAFFGREIGLMYTHSHLRYAEAMALIGDEAALWDALLKVNPIAVTERLGNASLRQRNAYFSSSDAAFPDRYRASSEWDRVKSGAITVDGGWRIYSSGPGLYVNMLIRHVLGRRRYFGESVPASSLSHKRTESR